MCTGLEPLLLGLGASSASVGALATGLGAAGVGILGSHIAKQLAPKTPAPTIATPEKPPQATKAPDRTAMLAANASAAMPGAMRGNSSTFLSGTGGIDMSTLNLGRNTLLGS